MRTMKLWLRYALILANVYKRGIQKVEFTIKKK